MIWFVEYLSRQLSVISPKKMEDGWSAVNNGILKFRSRLEEGVLLHVLPIDECMRHYTTIYNMHKCNQDNQEFYDKYRDSINEYIASVVSPALRNAQSRELMLRELVRRWEIYRVMVRYMSKLFYYLEIHFIPRHSLPTLREVGLLCFHGMVYDHEMRINLKDALMTLIGREHEGERIDGDLVKNVLAIFEEIRKPGDIMDFYANDFETAIFEGVGAYYSEKAASWILDDSCSGYLLKVEECLKREDRVAHYLHPNSQQKLLQIVQTKLLSRYQTRLLENEHSGCLALLREYRENDLLRMCRLFCRIPNGLEPIANIFKTFVISEGASLVQLAEDDIRDKVGKKDLDGIKKRVAYLGTVVELHDKYMKYVSYAFQHRTSFYLALNEAVEIFCNKEIAGNTSAQALATLCADLVKNVGNEKLSDDDIEVSFPKVFKFVSYVRDKDSFEELYRKKLARRLLPEKTTNINYELSILSKLKQCCGGQMTSKMEGMVADLTRENDRQTRFTAYLTDNPNIHLEIDLTVTVLTTRFWPIYNYSELNLPLEMAKCVEVFRDFYSTETKRRQLRWIYSMGTCNIIGRFDVRPIEMLAVRTYQAALLLLFNASEKLSYPEIKSQLNLTNEEYVSRLLHSVACSRYRVLLKVPNTTTVITDHDSFEFNPNFRSRTTEIKLPMKKRTIEVFEDRPLAIDACIVRIMKNRKVLPYKQLISECMEHLGRMFKLDIKSIMPRIEALITREYLERDEQDCKILRYLS